MSCNCLLVRIDPNDIAVSTGNTLYNDNTIYLDGVLNCDTTPFSEEFTERGYSCFCITTSGDCSVCDGVGWVTYDENTCYRITTTAATAPSYTLTTEPVTYNQYSRYGARFYKPGFCVCGSGDTYASVTTEVVWANSALTTTYGPLNRSGIWDTPTLPFEKWLGFSVCLSGISETKTYYVGIGADDYFRFVLDGVEILNSKLPPNPYTPSNGSAFKYWHVYPVEIGSGDHTLEVWGYNDGSQGGFGCEIYDADLSTLTGATNISELNIIFTTSAQTEFTVVQDEFGNYLSSGYTCPSGYVYSTCSGTCIQYEFCETTLTPSLYYYQDDVLYSGGSILSTYVIQDSTCSVDEDCCSDICTTSGYCISNTGNPEYDDNYEESGLYEGRPYWVGNSNGLYIYYSTGDTQWCLSLSLGGPCFLSGKSPCPSTCPDLNGVYFNSGICLTPTPTPTINCDVLDFTSIFDCEFEPTPTPTPTPSITPTITPTPSSTNVCSIIGVEATISSYSPTPTPTPTVTPTSSGIVDRPCQFYGDVSFNTVDEVMNCPISKQFQDCFNGTMYYTTNSVINPSGGDLTKFMVFNSTVDGLNKCISYVGTTTQIIGVNDITLNSGPYGYSNLGGCMSCLITPTPSPTNTQTPTPTSIPIL